MKTYTDLYPRICTFPALYRAYLLCCKGKRDKEYAIEFEQDLEGNLLTLHEELVEEVWQPGAYSRFFVEDPKRRLINAPRSRTGLSTMSSPMWSSPRFGGQRSSSTHMLA